MGEYEPDDSRNVTLEPGREPGGIERTGPREDEARRSAEQRERDKAEDDGVPAGAGRRMPQPQQRGRQWQRPDGQGQGQELGPNQGARPGDQPQAIDNPAGGARPVYDQYEVNQPGNINKQAGAARAASGAKTDRQEQDLRTKDIERRQQAAMQQDALTRVTA